MWPGRGKEEREELSQQPNLVAEDDVLHDGPANAHEIGDLRTKGKHTHKAEH